MQINKDSVKQSSPRHPPPKKKMKALRSFSISPMNSMAFPENPVFICVRIWSAGSKEESTTCQNMWL